MPLFQFSFSLIIVLKVYRCKGEDFLIVPIQRFKENIWENSDYADWKMFTMQPWKICNSFDINHQAHIRGGWKIWILCHMCSYQKNNMIFGFLKTMWIWQDLPKSSKRQSWLRNRTILCKFVISQIKIWVKTQHNFFTENLEFAREIQQIWTLLDFGEIKDKFYWFLISFQKVWCQ